MTGALFRLLSCSLAAIAAMPALFSCALPQDNGTVVKKHSAPDLSVQLLDVIIPDSIPSQVKDYKGFRISFNAGNHTPNWVAWELLATETDGGYSRSNKFWTDFDVEGCPGSKDYTNSGFDRGHMCPAGDNKSTKEMMQESFVMTNICPQAGALNKRAWKKLEEQCREWARRDSALIIVCGPVYRDKDTKRLGETGVRVPSAFFKAIIAPYVENPRGIGFIFPNMLSPGNMFSYAMPIDKIEEITGFDFFHQLPDDIENTIESKIEVRQWQH